MRMHSAVPSLLLALLVQLPLAAGCSDDSAGPNGDDETLVGAWTATSFTAPAPLGDLIALGLDFEITFASDGTFSIVVGDDDLNAFCDVDVTDCTLTGDYTATSSSITLVIEDGDTLTFNYQIQGSTMTWTGTIGGAPVTATLQKD